MTDLQLSELCRLVDEQSDAFERAWAEGNQPSIADFLDVVAAEIRQAVFVELLAMEMELNARAGKWPDIEAYSTQFPTFGEEISQAVDEFQSWAQSSDTIDEGLKSRLAAADQDTERQTLETHEWTPADGATSASQSVGTPPSDVDLPQRIGRYEVLRKLGQGGMGTVLLARDSVLDRKVALKLPHFETHEGDQAIPRFHREARAMATVQHPNLCPIHDVGEHDGHPYITMAYIDGKSLGEEIAAAGLMETVRAVQLVHQLALAMQAVHEAGVLHRDLKPSNVMIDQQGEPHITDFGLASRDRQSEAELTQSGTVIGSPAYMAPEQVSGVQAAFGPHTDIYALGVILYQLLCGRRPFEGTGLAVLGQITSGKSPPPPSELADVDEQLEAICLKAMAHEVDDRFQSARELANSLQAWLRRADAPIAMRTGKRMIFVVASCALLLCVGVAAFLAYGRSPWPKDDANTRGGRSLQLPVPSAPNTVHFVDSGQELGNGDSSAVRLGDFDKDGDLDAFVINRYDQPNRVWLNDGNAAFHDSGQELGNSYSWDVASGDIDNDGDLDAIVVNSRTQPSRIWLNDGQGNFSDSGHTISSVDAHGIGLADLDGDGDLDAVIADKGANAVWKNDGSGRFSDSGQRLGAMESWCVALADFNGDGSVDAFFGNRGVGAQGKPNRVWFNDGRGSFTDSGQSLDSAPTIGVSLADLNGDGVIDAFAANDGYQPNRVWLNDGNGRFRGLEQQGDLVTVLVSLGDLDGDNDVDAFVANSLNHPNQILLNNGHAEFTLGLNGLLGRSASNGAALGDLDGDGDLDAFVSNFKRQPNRVWINSQVEPRPKTTRIRSPPPVPSKRSAVDFVDSGQEFEPDNSTAVAAGDLDRDGDVDVIVTRDDVPNQVWLNNGSGRFSMHQELDGDGFGDVTLGDLDSDGDLDAAFVRASPDEPGGIWLNDGQGTFTDTGQSLMGNCLWEIELADLDGDTDLDAVVVDRKGPNLVFRNDGSGQLINTDQALGNGNSAGVRIGDLDGDGDGDLFIGNYSKLPNTVWLNNGHGVFTNSGQKLGSSTTHAVAIADLDHDGDLDAYAANVGGTDSIWSNDGFGTFSESKPTEDPQASSAVVIADLNGDNRADVFIVNGFRGAESGQILLSTGNDLAFETYWSPAATATDVALADFDNDGDVDAFVATYHDAPNRVWLNSASDSAGELSSATSAPRLEPGE